MEWGPEIKVDGQRPHGLMGSDVVQIHGWEEFGTTYVKFVEWCDVKAIKLAATHPYYHRASCSKDFNYVHDKDGSIVTALSTQIGGSHYKDMTIQPMEYSMANSLDALQHTIVKYVSRFRDKNGIEDLEKAKHCIDMLIEWEMKDEA